MNSQMKGYIGRGLGGSGVQELLSLWSRGVSLPCVDAFGNRSATWKLPEPCSTGIFGGVLTQVQSVITPF